VAAGRLCALLMLGGALLVGGRPGEARADPLRFAVVGHLRPMATGELYFRLDELLDEVARTRPELVFLTGDLIWGDYNDATVDRSALEADWEALDAALARLDVPVYRVPGNHDINDPVSRDVYLERYGGPSRVIEKDRTRFVLLSSVPLPQGDGPAELPRPHTRPEALGPDGVAFLREALADPDSYDRAFVFVHHLLWWREDAPWWRDVHPLLVRGKVRAVFGGDYGPLKFSHESRDGIDYLQSAVEGPNPNTRLLRNLEGSRILNFQLDNFLAVTVHGDEVRYDVEVVGALSSGKLSPTRYREIFAPRPVSLGERVDRALGGPIRRAVLAALLVGTFAAGFALGRRRR
jgi:hypothetical protein